MQRPLVQLRLERRVANGRVERNSAAIRRTNPGRGAYFSELRISYLFFGWCPREWIGQESNVLFNGLVVMIARSVWPAARRRPWRQAALQRYRNGLAAS